MILNKNENYWEKLNIIKQFPTALCKTIKENSSFKLKGLELILSYS